MAKSDTSSNDEFDLETFLPFRLHQASEAVSQSFRSIYKHEYGMTRSEWRVLAHLGQYGAMTATEIGRSASLHKTKVSRAVFSLETRRWLSRAPDQRDRRVQILSLTKSGHQAYRRLGSRAQQYNDQLAKKLGKDKVAEIVHLADALQRVVKD
ncbi:MAG: MarR family transcriptional regulator [Rhizobiaceae bacterium]|nr:MarR family transcriptional regulator [Rhizobiaceae bacterium]